MKTITVAIENLETHPELNGMLFQKKRESVETTMLLYGVMNPIKVVQRDEKYYVIDGNVRLGIAKQYSEHFAKLECIHFDIPDSEVKRHYILFNSRGERSVLQILSEYKSACEFIGKQQGMKRDISQLRSKWRKVKNPDWKEIAALITGGHYSKTTLEKLETIVEEEMKLPASKRLGLVKKIDDGEISIDKAHSLTKLFTSKLDLERRAKEAKVLAMSFKNTSEKPYKIYHQSSLEMSAVENNSIDLIVTSHGYAGGQRQYRNQDNLSHGQEKTNEEYIENFGKFANEQFNKLKPGGVLTSIIGESYKGGYQSICARAELKLRDIGFEILDVVIWEKINQKYTPHDFRYQNVKENIIIAMKPGKDPTFNPQLRKGSVEKHTLKRTSSKGYYIANPETSITNVIRTSVFDPSVFKKIDPEFRHDAPAPEELYDLLIKTYSNPGDTILDPFMGSGTIGVGLKLGRKVIGYDVDQESIVFSQKRFEYFLKETENETLSIAA